MNDKDQSTRSAVFLTNGCPENRLDAASMLELWRSQGRDVSSDVSNADLILFNACGLTDANEMTSLEIIKDIRKKKKKSCRLIVCGCLPRINPAALEGIYEDITFGSDDIKSFSKLINADQSRNYPCANYLLPITTYKNISIKSINRFNKLIDPYFTLYHLLLNKRYSRYGRERDISNPRHYFIKIATGCVHRCSYCAVRLSRGPIHSKPIENILQEVRKGLMEGFSDIALLATDSGSYGVDRNATFVDLLNEILSIPGDFRIRLRNVHPQFLTFKLPDLVPIFKTGRIVHMTSAIQSGNNRILKLMNRNYTVESCCAAYDALKKACPSLQIRSQIIVGFPGETEAEFQDSLKVIDTGLFDFMEVYQFSPRINTPAAALANNLSSSVVSNRYYRLVKKIVEQIENGRGTR